MSTISPKSEGVVTIRYIVMSLLNRLSDYTLKSYKRLAQIAIEGFGELSLFHLENIEVVYLHMSTAKTVNLPADFIDYLKIGVPINGKLRVLTQHEQILLPRVFDDTGVAVGNTDEGTTEVGLINPVFFSDHFRNGQFIGGLFGLPGGVDTAYYRVDMERRQIVFSGDVPRSEIVLEYISNGVKLDGSSLIPREAIPALRTYVLWQMMEGSAKNKYDFIEIARRKQEHEEAVNMLRDFQTEFTADEYRRMVWQSSKQTPKR